MSRAEAPESREHGSTYPLLAALLAIIVVAPFGTKLGSVRVVFDVLLSAVIVAGVWAARDRRMLLWGAALGGPALALMWLGVARQSSSITAAGFVFGLATILLIAAIVLRGVLTARHVTLSTVTGGGLWLSPAGNRLVVRLPPARELRARLVPQAGRGHRRR